MAGTPTRTQYKHKKLLKISQVVFSTYLLTLTVTSVLVSTSKLTRQLVQHQLAAFDLSGLTSLRLGSIGAQLGAQINEFSTDTSLSQNSNEKVPTQAAVKAYIDSKSVSTIKAAAADAFFQANS